MARRSTGLVVLFIWCMYLRFTGAQGMKEGKDSELDEHLNHVNKRAITTIQIKPKSHRKEENNEEKKYKEEMIENKVKEMWVNGKGCPSGTVPIRKHTADELKNAKLAAEAYGQKVTPMSVQDPGVHYAVLRTKAPGLYYGGGMSVSSYNPKVVGSQYSGARLKLQNEPESIEVGWMVNPSLNGDSRTRVFVYTNAGKSHCFNTHCPGIITVRPDIPIDFVVEPTSTTGKDGKRYVLQFFIYKDEANGNWFFELGNEGRIIGFWPQSAFTTMANSANYVEWGGIVYSPPNVPSPPMGSGNTKLYEDTRQDAYCKLITFINKDHKLVDASDTEIYTDIGTYEAKDFGYFNDHFRRLIVFGGYGGHTGN